MTAARPGTVRRWPALMTLPLRRFAWRSDATFVRYSCAMDDSVSPRFTRWTARAGSDARGVTRAAVRTTAGSASSSPATAFLARVASDGPVMDGWTRDDQLLAGLEARTRREVVGRGQIRAAHTQLLCDSRDGLTAPHAIRRKRIGQVRRGRQRPVPHHLAHPQRDAQRVVAAAGRRGPAPQFRVQVLEHVEGRAGVLGQSPQVQRRRDRHHFAGHLDHRLERQSVLGRIARHDHRRQDQRHVVPRLARQETPARAECPEIRMARPIHGALHAAPAAVVGRQRQMPVAELVVQELQVLGGGARGLLGIRALVDVPVVLQPDLERRAVHELPDATRLAPARARWA